MPTIVATPAASNANSYLTVVEYLTFLDTRLRVIAAADVPPGVATVTHQRALITATRVMDAAFNVFAGRTRAENALVPYAWTGSPATDTQALLWPRIGMVSRTGAAIPDDVIPDDLKAATSELAYQLEQVDLTATDDVAAKGIKSVTAGSVAVVFERSGEAGRPTGILPDAVLAWLVPSWYTPEIVVTPPTLLFEVF